MPFSQVYDPLASPALSTLAALLPVVVLLGCLGLARMKAHLAALAGLGAAAGVGILLFRQPPGQSLAAAVYGAAYGFLPIGWIILNVLFLYTLTLQKGLFETLKDSLTRITPDRRLQLLLVAFCFGAFFEGAAGFGTPVAVTGSILVGLGFSPISAAGLALMANTAPVPYAGLGTPLVALQGVTGLDLRDLTVMVARQLMFFNILIPFWITTVFCGWKAMLEVWPALLVAGASFAGVQYAVAALHGPWLVNILSALASMAALAGFLRVWRPRRIYRLPGDAAQDEVKLHTPREVRQAWLPWLILSATLFIWGLPQVKAWLDSISLVRIAVPGLHQLVQRVPPIVPAARLENALFEFNWLSASGTGILLAAFAAGLQMGFSPAALARAYWTTLKQARFALLTISTMMALGFVTRYAGMDATLGLAFAQTGVLYPFFGTLLGWMGVVLTGSDTSSNVLFGSLQRLTAERLGIDPLVMSAANTSGGVMGKMVNAQSIVVASAATGSEGRESAILRYVFFHSLALAALVGVVVMVMAAR